MSTKTCTRCGEMKPLDEFGVDKRVSHGRKGKCRPCEAAHTKEWRHANRERYRESQRQWRRTNTDRARELQRRWLASRSEEQRQEAARRKHRYAIAQKYGVTEEQYEAMLAAQGGGCAVCCVEDNRLAVDHCHDTGRVRGLLCRGCNTAAGLLRDDPERMRALADYVEAASKGTKDMVARARKADLPVYVIARAM